MKIQIAKLASDFFDDGRIPFALTEDEINELGEKLNCRPLTEKLPDGSLRIIAQINGNDYCVDFNKKSSQYNSWFGAEWEEKITIHTKDEEYKKTVIEGICKGTSYFDERRAEEISINGFVLNEGMIIVHAKYITDSSHSFDIYIDYYDADVVDFLRKNGLERQGGNQGLHNDITTFTTFLEAHGISPNNSTKKSFYTTKEWCFIDVLNEMNYGFRIYDILVDLLLQEVKKVELPNETDNTFSIQNLSSDLNLELKSALGNHFCQMFSEDSIRELGQSSSLAMGSQIIFNINRNGEAISCTPTIGYTNKDQSKAYISATGLRKKSANFTFDFYTNNTLMFASRVNNWHYAKVEDSIVIFDNEKDPKTLLKVQVANDKNGHLYTIASGIVLSSDGGMYLITTTGFFGENPQAYNDFPTGNIVLQHFDSNIVSFLKEQGIVMPKVSFDTKKDLDVTNGSVIEVETNMADVDFSKLKASIEKYGLLPDSVYSCNNYDSSTGRSKIIKIFANILKDGERYCSKKCGNRTRARENTNNIPNNIN